MVGIFDLRQELFSRQVKLAFVQLQLMNNDKLVQASLNSAQVAGVYVLTISFLVQNHLQLAGGWPVNRAPTVPPDVELRSDDPGPGLRVSQFRIRYYNKFDRTIDGMFIH